MAGPHPTNVITKEDGLHKSLLTLNCLPSPNKPRQHQMDSMPLLFFFFFFFSSCGGDQRSFNVWYPDQSFTLNSSSSSSNSFSSFLVFPVIVPDNFSSFFPDPISTSSLTFLCLISPLSSRSYTLSICMSSLIEYIGIDTSYFNYTEPVIVWSANRGNPIHGENISLTFDIDGNLALRGEANKVVWATNTSGKGAVRMELSQHPPTNLSLYDSNNNIIWQSIDYPTDSLTIGQTLKRGMKLVSWASPNDSSEGNYSLVAEPSGIVLYHNFPAPQPYWILTFVQDPLLQLVKNSTFTENNYTEAFIDSKALLWGSDSQGSLVLFMFQSVGGNGSFLKLEWNGHLRVYGDYDIWQDNSPKLFDLFSGSRLCGLPMHCGPYGVCRGDGLCSCPSPDSASSFVELDNITHSCGLARPLQSCNASPNQIEMLRFTRIDYFSNTFNSPLIHLSTEERCEDECLKNCSCLAAFWHNHSRACFHVDQMGGLVDSSGLYQSRSLTMEDQPSSTQLCESYVTFLKVDAIANHNQSTNASSRKYAIGIVVGISAALLVTLCLLYFIYRHRVGTGLEREEEEAILDAIPGLPTRFSYKDLHSITNGFADKLGQGGFGSVYAGTLLSNGTSTKVAVKQLEGIRQGDKEFRSEVAIMGGIHHFHLLHLLGYCAQGRHRLLVYEYMENGSLDQWLFINRHLKTPLSWDVRYKIALGAARGLAYLHEECRERIIHLDIKPQNILLDENFVPKVADFGLSRLMERDMSHVMTTMRGTPGYLAPEWLNEGSIDEKCDVFSFGKLLMEIISGRKNLDHTVESEEHMYYPEWAFWKAQEGNDVLGELTDATIESGEERMEVRRMINTSFLCVLENPTLRPSMEKVVQMLEGHVPVSHIQLATLHQGLFFVLRNPSDFAQTQIKEAVAGIHASTSANPRPTTCYNTSYGSGLSSFNISTR